MVCQRGDGHRGYLRAMGREKPVFTQDYSDFGVVRWLECAWVGIACCILSKTRGTGGLGAVPLTTGPATTPLLRSQLLVVRTPAHGSARPDACAAGAVFGDSRAPIKETDHPGSNPFWLITLLLVRVSTRTRLVLASKAANIAVLYPYYN